MSMCHLIMHDEYQYPVQAFKDDAKAIERMKELNEKEIKYYLVSLVYEDDYEK